MVDQVKKRQWDSETMTRIKNLGLDMSKIFVYHNGYLYFKHQRFHQRLHCILGHSKLQEDFDAFLAEGFNGTIGNLNAVAHINDNKQDCNLKNLMNMPEAWNYNLKKVKGA